MLIFCPSELPPKMPSDAERFRSTVDWGQRNLAGRGLQGVLSSVLAFDGSGRFLLARTEASVTEPWLFRTRTRGLASICRMTAAITSPVL